MSQAPWWIIYFVRSGPPGGPIKIGVTVDLLKRIKLLQTGNPEKLVLLRAITGDALLERELHARFKHIRIHGEWFKPTDELLSFIDQISDAWANDFNESLKRPCTCGRNQYTVSQLPNEAFVALCRRCLMRQNGHMNTFLTRCAHRERPYVPPKPCSHCAVPSKPLRKGRCHTCHEYYRRHGVDRDLSLPRKKICANCNKECERLSRSRCRICYSYWYQYGVERGPDDNIHANKGPETIRRYTRRRLVDIIPSDTSHSSGPPSVSDPPACLTSSLSVPNEEPST